MYKWQPIPDVELEMPLEFGLHDAGILRVITDPLNLRGNYDESLAIDLAGLRAVKPALDDVERQLREQGVADTRDGRLTYLSVGQQLGREAANDIRTRRVAIHLEAQSGTRVVPVLKSSFVRREEESSRVDLLRVVLNRLPLPNDATPWEAIFDWRQDEEAQIQYRRIISAISAAAANGVHPADFEDEIATKLDDYARAMALRHRMMAQSRLEVFFVTSMEVIEDLLHFKFGSAAKKLIAADRTEVQLLKDELSIPGREFAYIASANSRFGSDSLASG